MNLDLSAITLLQLLLTVCELMLVMLGRLFKRLLDVRRGLSDRHGGLQHMRHTSCRNGLRRRAELQLLRRCDSRPDRGLS